MNRIAALLLILMAWQLANDPRPYPEEVDRPRHLQEIITWVDQTAAFIKAGDPHHLVTTGNEGVTGVWNRNRVILTPIAVRISITCPCSSDC